MSKELSDGNKMIRGLKQEDVIETTGYSGKACLTPE